MGSTPDISALDQDLDRVLEQMAAKQDGGRIATSAASRRRRVEWQQWIALAWTAAVITACALVGLWWMAAGLVLFAIPIRIELLLRRRQALRELETTDDWLALEQKVLEQRARRMRSSAVYDALIAVLFGVLALIGKHPAAAGIVAGVFALSAAYHFLRRVPRADAELREFAGVEIESRASWYSAIAVLVLILGFPFFAIWAFFRRDESDSEEEGS